MALLSAPERTPQIHSASLAVIAFAAAVALLYFGRALCITFIVSVILAFMLDPFVGFFMRMKFPRPFASFLVCSIALLMIYLAGVGVVSQLSNLAEELPEYSQRVNVLVDSVAVQMETFEQNAYKLIVPKRFQQNIPAPPDPQANRRRTTRRADAAATQPPAVQEVRIHQDRPPLINYLYGYISSFYNVLLMISFVPFLVYFMLSWRDHVRRSFLSMFEGNDRVIAGKSWQGIAHMARAYVVGNFILGFVLAVASSITFYSWHLPYSLLIGFFSGFLSLVPYVGLPLALIPPLAAALMTYSSVTPFLLISAIVAFLHLLALNLFYPSVVGARVHLNPLAVTVALMFWGTIWGALGLILAIPITAGIKTVFDNVDHLRPYGAMLGD